MRAPAQPSRPTVGRLDAIDWLRGAAVVLMIQTHLYDAWVHHAAKKTGAYMLTRYLGGIPARLFLFLVGVSLAIRFESQLRKGVARADMVAGAARRGLAIVGLAYLFRLQEWTLAGFWGPWTDLARVDILNCIGLSLVVVPLVAAPRGARPAYATALLAAAFFLGLGPIVGPAHFPSWLPQPLTSYVGGERPMAWFPMFPWLAWPFVGLAVGHLWVRAAADPRRERLVYLASGVAGLALIQFVNLVRRLDPHIIRYPSELVQQMGPGSFFYRLGQIGLIAALSWAATRLPRGRFSPMLLLGQTSLFVYWIHVDLCYGLISKRLHGRLGMPAATVGFVLMTAAMVGLSAARLRWFDPWWKARRTAPRRPERTPA